MKRLFTAVIIASAFTAHGTTYYWDNNSNSAGFGSAGGTWGVDSLWSADSDGLTIPSVKHTSAEDDLHFGTDIDGLAGGVIGVQGTGQTFRTLRFGAASGEITITGGTLNVASPSSTIIVSSTANTNTIGSALAGNNGVQFELSVNSDLFHSEFLTNVATVIFADATLADYGSAAGKIGGGSVGSPRNAQVFHFVNNGSTATYQLQFDDGVYIKCVGVELKQVGPDITAQASYARYISKTDGQLGYDFENQSYNTQAVATSSTANGYGAAETELFPRLGHLNLTGCNTYSGNTTISHGILRLDGSGLLNDGAYEGDIFNSGALHFNSDSNQVLSGSISGRGSLWRSAVEQPQIQTYHPAALPRASNEEPAITIAENLQVADCIGVTGSLGGPGIGANPIPAVVYFFNNNSEVATWQLQYFDGTYTKCAKVELKQVGAEISARMIYAKYVEGNSLGLNFDSEENPGSYEAHQTALTFKPQPTLTLSGTNSYAGGTIVDRGRLLATTTTKALPEVGGIIVNSGGELVLNVKDVVSSMEGVGNNNPIRVNGGRLTIATSFNTKYSCAITIDSGVINSTVAGDDGGNYMNNLTLMNGATVIGNKIRVGNYTSPMITVTGSSACSIPAGINMLQNKKYKFTMTFNVADVTNDSAADLTVSGVIRDFSPDYAGLPILKTGAGTLSFSATNTHIGEINIDAGALALDGNGSLNTNNPVVLNGGALEISAFTNNVGTLTLSGDSTLVLGSGAIAFADSSAINWSNTLSLNGTLDKKSVRFGIDNTGLTGTQLNAIDYDGSTVVLDRDGYLIPAPMGTVIIVQ